MVLGRLIASATPAPWINPRQRVPGIVIQVGAAGESDRIRIDEATDIRIVEPEGVVVQPGLAVQVLPLEAQIL